MKPALPGGVGDQLIAQPAEDGVHQLRRSGRDSQARPGLVDVADGVAGAIAAPENAVGWADRGRRRSFSTDHDAQHSCDHTGSGAEAKLVVGSCDRGCGMRQRTTVRGSRSMTRTRAAIAVSALALSVTLGPSAGAAPAPVADRALDRALKKVVRAPGGPPGVISLVRRGGRTFVHRAGVADLESKRRWRTSDHMRLASTSKAFSGAVALSLVRRGRLELDDTIGERLPGLPPAWSAVTLGQALHHKSGLPDYTTDAAFQADVGADPLRRFTPLELIGYVASEPLLFPPGSAYNYSNTDNVVVGLMAEAATGQPYERLLRTRVYSPLGLSETSLPSGPRLPRPFAHGYEFDPPRPPEDISEVASMSWVWASGGMQSTPLELGRFMRGYVSGRLFGRALRRRQRAWVDGHSEPIGPGANSAGLALFRYRTRCGTVFGHTGNFPGYTQFAAASSDGRRSATVSANTQLNELMGSPFPLLRRAFERAACAALASRQSRSAPCRRAGRTARAPLPAIGRCP
jgi:D-alanyl-D-alanine carboxypeptidase